MSRNTEKEKARKAAYADAHREILNEKARIRMAKRRREHKEEISAYTREWKRLHRKSRASPLAKERAKERIEKAYDILAYKNAIQAFNFFIRSKAQDWWLDRYYLATGRPWLDHRLTNAERNAERYRTKYRTNDEFAVMERMRRQIKKAKTKDGIAYCIRAAIANDGTSRKVERELGYTINELKESLYKQFTYRMTWERFKKGDIHIDHIIPKSAFNLEDDNEWRLCWAIANLRPTWRKDNLAKSDKHLFLI
jgi:hypothetical protein